MTMKNCDRSKRFAVLLMWILWSHTAERESNYCSSHESWHKTQIKTTPQLHIRHFSFFFYLLFIYSRNYILASIDSNNPSSFICSSFFHLSFELLIYTILEKCFKKNRKKVENKIPHHLIWSNNVLLIEITFLLSVLPFENAFLYIVCLFYIIVLSLRVISMLNLFYLP